MNHATNQSGDAAVGGLSPALRKTAVFLLGGIGMFLLGNAVQPRLRQSAVAPEADRVLFPELSDPAKAASMEIISFDDEPGRIMRAFESWGHPAQMSLLIGPELAELSSLTSNYLPKPSIDLATRRMGDLLRQRYGPAPSTTTPSTSGSPA